MARPIPLIASRAIPAEIGIMVVCPNAIVVAGLGAVEWGRPNKRHQNQPTRNKRFALAVFVEVVFFIPLAPVKIAAKHLMINFAPNMSKL